MKWENSIFRKLLYPPKGILCLLPLAMFGILIFIFVTGKEYSWFAYPIYFLSAYCLTILIAAMPRTFKKIKRSLLNSKRVKNMPSNAILKRYFTDMSFRGGFALYQGMVVNFLYAAFRTVTGIIYSSSWFISMAVYHFVLGGMRAYLVFAFKRKDENNLLYEYGCYLKIAWLLFLLHIPMGEMIRLVVVRNSSFSYPGYVIYLSAIYTFYTMGIAIGNLIKFKKFGSPILSAAKVLNFVSAMMSVLGLQTAMITAFSSGDDHFRKLMNTITGAFVYAAVVIISVCMIISATVKKKREKDGMG